MKKFLAITFLGLTACGLEGQGLFGSVCYVTDAKKNTAQSYYNSFGTLQTSVSEVEAKKLFGPCYKRNDKFFSYKTLWGEKLVLVRWGEAVTFAERKK